VRALLSIILAASPVLTGCGSLPSPHAGPMPDDPARGGTSSYQSIVAGTKSYRPVEPLPWNDINRGVAPKGALPPKGEPGPKDGKAPPSDGAPPHSKH
jgi:hypothetical protein